MHHAVQGVYGGALLLDAREETLSMVREAISLLFKAQQIERFGRVPTMGEALADLREAVGPIDPGNWMCQACGGFLARCECS